MRGWDVPAGFSVQQGSTGPHVPAGFSGAVEECRDCVCLLVLAKEIGSTKMTPLRPLSLEGVPTGSFPLQEML